MTRTQNFVRYVGEMSITILVFILDNFQEKLEWQNFSKKQKTRFWDHSRNFFPKFFPGKKGSVSVSILELSTIVLKMRKP